MKRIGPSFLLTVCLLAASLVLSSVGNAQDARDTKAMSALKAETAKLGAPKIQGSDLYFGNTKVSADLVDAVVKKNGGVATLFAKSGDQYVRVATTVKKEDGTSAVGTALDANSHAPCKAQERRSVLRRRDCLRQDLRR